MKQELNDYFSYMANQNRISHAFLLCNTDYPSVKEGLSFILNNYFFDNSVDIDNCLDVIVVNPVDDRIVKDQILELQEKLKTKSTVNNNRVYIINEAHKMNEYASNSLLKFLEEPKEGIYAFLVTTNINKILPTIKSRCQILSIQNISVFDLRSYSDDMISKVLKLISLIEEKKSSCFGYLYDIINKKEEKNNVVDIVKIMKYFYSDVLNYTLGRNVVYFKEYLSDIKLVSEVNSTEEVVRKLLLLSKNENRLNYNLNVSLFMIKLIIEMVGEGNEKCSSGKF